MLYRKLFKTFIYTILLIIFLSIWLIFSNTGLKCTINVAQFFINNTSSDKVHTTSPNKANNTSSNKVNNTSSEKANNTSSEKANNTSSDKANKTTKPNRNTTASSVLGLTNGSSSNIKNANNYIKFETGKITGTLYSGFSIKELVYKQNDKTIVIDNIDLNIKLLDLITKKSLNIKHFNVKNINGIADFLPTNLNFNNENDSKRAKYVISSLEGNLCYKLFKNEANLSLDKLEGTWNNKKLSAKLYAYQHNGIFSVFNNSYVKLGKNTIDIALNNSNQIKWALKIHNLTDFVETYTGEIYSTGKINNLNNLAIINNFKNKLDPAVKPRGDEGRLSKSLNTADDNNKQLQDDNNKQLQDDNNKQLQDDNNKILNNDNINPNSKYNKPHSAINANIEIKNLNIENINIQNLNTEISGSISEESNLSITSYLKDAIINDNIIKSAKLELKGKTKNHKISTILNIDENTIEANFTGSINSDLLNQYITGNKSNNSNNAKIKNNNKRSTTTCKNMWCVTLNSGLINTTNFGKWKFEKNNSFIISNDKIFFDELKLISLVHPALKKAGEQNICVLPLPDNDPTNLRANKNKSKKLKKSNNNLKNKTDLTLPKTAKTTKVAKAAKVPLEKYAENGYISSSLNWDLTKNKWNILVNGKTIGLGIFKNNFPKTVEISGAASFEVKAHNFDDQLNVTGHLELPNLDANVATYEKITECFNFNFGEAKFRILNNKLEVNANIESTNNDYLKASVNVDNFIEDFHSDNAKKSNKQKLSGAVNAKFKNLKLLNQFVPEISKLNGELEINGKLEGNLQKPTFTSSTKIQKVYFRIPELGINVNPLNITINSDKDGKFKLSGYATTTANKNNQNNQNNQNIKANSIKLDGSFEPFNPSFPNKFTISGNNVLFAKLKGTKVNASPNITFTLKNFEKLKITGKILINNTRIDLDSLPINKTIVSDDVKFINNHLHENNNSKFQIKPDILVRITDNVIISGHGLKKCIVTGKIRVHKAKNKLLGDGRASIKSGYYLLSGSPFKIDRGRLRYPAGTLLTNPKLDIKMRQKSTKVKTRSEKRSDELGIYIHGTLLNPTLDLNFNEGDVPSKLISSALNISGGGLTDKITSSVPIIDEISFERLGSASKSKNLEDQETVIIFGKKISKGLYLHFVKSLMEGESGRETNKLKMKYKLSDTVTLGLETGSDGAGAELSFIVEKD